MINPKYHIGFFTYNKENNTLYADEGDLYVPNFAIAFPNGGRQFYIINPRTNQSRRFRVVSITDKEYIFISEDKVNCIISKQIFNP